MIKILAFAGSNSKNSINKKLVLYAGNQLNNVNLQVLDLNDFNLPLYGIDYELKNGIPEEASNFLNLIKNSKGIILSLAEHNGAYSSAFKNIFDWMSRIDGKLWSNLPMLLMSASPGARGGASVMSLALTGFPHMGGHIIAKFSLPLFNKNFADGEIVDPELKKLFKKELKLFQKGIN
jgi:NAD(P)H-dependent FMN reductase